MSTNELQSAPKGEVASQVPVERSPTVEKGTLSQEKSEGDIVVRDVKVGKEGSKEEQAAMDA